MSITKYAYVKDSVGSTLDAEVLAADLAGYKGNMWCQGPGMDALTLYFDPELSAEDKTTLDGVVDDHTTVKTIFEDAKDTIVPAIK